MQWLESLILGVVQGLTEFLPVSSDGHLSITQQAFDWWQGKRSSGAENMFFDVMLHVGTLAAIVLHYRAVVMTGAKGLLGSNEVPPAYRRPAVIRVGMLAFVATLPLIPLALFLKKWIEAAFQSVTAAGVGFLITAAVLLVTTLLRKDEKGKGPAETTWLDALLIGLAQMFAPLPGVSRSGLTVASALALGLSRSWAVGFSLLIAVPAILGATVLELRKLDPATMTPDRAAQTVAAAVVAGVVGYGAIIWLVKIVRSGRLWYFSVYLIVLATIVLTLVAIYGEPAHAEPRVPDALDRPARREAPRPTAERGPGGTIGPLGCSVGPGARPGDSRARPEVQALPGLARLDLGRSLA
jgi:undecaprenyl-diphosphatase